mmetsp:Transcript_31869/g.87729  ORF Transcript_31869/g.87729 Transcript_31869/m.87729 type:complete len:301 (-) Transcript_31869:925-1827(-)
MPSGPHWPLVDIHGLLLPEARDGPELLHRQEVPQRSVTAGVPASWHVLVVRDGDRLLRHLAGAPWEGLDVNTRWGHLFVAAHFVHPRGQLDVRLAAHRRLRSVRVTVGGGNRGRGLLHRLSAGAVRQLLDDPPLVHPGAPVARRARPGGLLRERRQGSALRRGRLLRRGHGAVAGPGAGGEAAPAARPAPLRGLPVQPMDKPDVQHARVLHQRVRTDQVPRHLQGPDSLAAVCGRHHLPGGHGEELRRVLGECFGLRGPERLAAADRPHRLAVLRHPKALPKRPHASPAHHGRRLGVHPG